LEKAIDHDGHDGRDETQKRSSCFSLCAPWLKRLSPFAALAAISAFLNQTPTTSRHSRESGNPVRGLQTEGPRMPRPPCSLSLKRFSPRAPWQKRARGFVLPSAIFLLVVLASLAAFLVTISQAMSVTSAQDVLGARAYQAARAGIEWGLHQSLDPAHATAVAPDNPAWPNMPGCAGGDLAIEGFAVAVRCVYNDYQESGSIRRIRVYRLTATASAGAVGSMGFIERQVEVTVAKCRAEDSAAQGYECP
jgi:MSHA biogenesis protein MshP